MLDLIKKAKEYAINCHSSTNHLYDGKPYEIHLQSVVLYAMKFLYLIEENNEKHNFIAAAWCHDVIEDCRQTYNDVLKATNKDVAELVYALTNEKGKNRKERANNAYYQGIRDVKYATLLKCCDRLANLEYSISTKSNMSEVYNKEHKNFISNVATSEQYLLFKDAFDEMEKFFIKK